MHSKLRELVENHPKHFAQMISRSPELLAEVNNISGDSIAEKVYKLLNPQTVVICEYGASKKFHSMATGYRFCGKPNSCQCARNTVAEKVSASKSSLTPVENANIHKKRVETNIKRYGVANTGQTKLAKERHKKLYENKDAVDEITQRVKATKKHKYGDENYNNNAQAQCTSIGRYGTSNPMKDSTIAKKSAKARREQYDPVTALATNYKQVVNNIREKSNLEVLTPVEDYQGVAVRPVWEFKCCSCGHEFSKRFDYGSFPKCHVCNPTPIFYKSQQELELLEFVKSNYEGKVISGDRQIISPYEVDIFLPDRNLAIEFCGLYWHCENSSGKGRLYHKRKMRLLNEKGIQLLTIFSDEYEKKLEVVQRIVLNKIGSSNIKTVPGRHCESVIISKEQANEFHDCWHIQGSSNISTVHIGLCHNNEIEMVMSFRKKKDDDWELTRMCSRKRIHGGASKLFSYFVKQFNPSTVITFSDLRWSQGEVYLNMGFELDGDVPPMQSYVVSYKNRFSKRKYSKSRLVSSGHSPDLSEWQILQGLGIDRIWDCGKKRFIWRSNIVAN
jgi:hypothetical protein